MRYPNRLAVCVTDGMRYKDALKYRDAAINDQPKEAAISRKTMIGIAGALESEVAQHIIASCLGIF